MLATSDDSIDNLPGLFTDFQSSQTDSDVTKLTLTLWENYDVMKCTFHDGGERRMMEASYAQSSSRHGVDGLCMETEKLNLNAVGERLKSREAERWALQNAGSFL